jgi:hypothetical protein
MRKGINARANQGDESAEAETAAQSEPSKRAAAKSNKKSRSAA